MRVLQVNKYFYIRGGAERVFFDTIKGLRERGHSVSEFSMDDPRNFESKFSSYFMSQLCELRMAMPLIMQWKVFWHLFYSHEVVKKLTMLVQAEEPEVAHLHNVYHHLSAAVFGTLKRSRVPIVLTLHDVFPLCPNHSLLNGETLGENLFKNKLYNCVRYKCIDGRFLPSLAGTLEAYYYRLRGIWKMVSLYICPSEFMKNKMVEYGFPAEKMRVVRNPFELAPTHAPLGNKIVYLGRVHFEKGIKVFMKALPELRNYPVVVAGSGPEERWVQNYIRENNLTNVERRGWVGGEAWQAVMNEARVIVVPSIFFENCSISILEALSNGRLVVASDRGGNPELVIDGKTGFLAKPEDPADLARVIKKAMELSPEQVNVITAAGRELVAKNHNPELYFKELLAIYHEAHDKHQ